MMWCMCMVILVTLLPYLIFSFYHSFDSVRQWLRDIDIAKHIWNISIHTIYTRHNTLYAMSEYKRWVNEYIYIWMCIDVVGELRMLWFGLPCLKITTFYLQRTSKCKCPRCIHVRQYTTTVVSFLTFNWIIIYIHIRI